jgi:hypothetical protein
MTKAYGLYLVSLFLLLALLFIVAHFGHYRKNPIAAIWLLSSLGMNVWLMVCLWAGERSAFLNASRGYQVMWWALAVGVIVNSVIEWQSPANRIIARGVGALVLMTLAVRLLTGCGLVGSGARMTTAINSAFLAPSFYLICALSNVSIDRLLLWVNQWQVASGKWQAAAGWARSFVA